MSDLDGVPAIVTGAASGIGRATARRLAADGANVLLADIQAEEGKQAASRIAEEEPGETDYVDCDVRDPADVASMVDHAVDVFGGLNIAVNNAGIEGEQARTHEQSEDNWDRVMAVNLKGVWRCMKAEIPHMLDGEGGSIVNVASIAGLVGFENISPYDASKHGVIGLTQSAALEYAQDEVRINAVAPGVIQTPMIDRFTQGDAEAEEQLAAGEPVGRLGRPEEVAETIRHLAGPEASFVTGTAVPVDGGWTAR